jgi:hypothetical protein
MLIIAFDRFASLKNPFKLNNLQLSINIWNLQHSQLKVHFVKLVFAWFCSFLFWMPLFIAGYEEQNDTCFLQMNGLIILIHSIFIYFLPFVLILLLYGLSFYHLHKNIRSFEVSTKSYTRKLAKSEIRVLKRLVFITTSFLVCWMPWTIVWNYEHLIQVNNISYEVYLTAFLLSYANSFINPLTIIFTNTRYLIRFKQAFHKITERWTSTTHRSYTIKPNSRRTV